MIISLEDEDLYTKKDILLYNAFHKECCSSEFTDLLYIFILINDIDHTYSEGDYINKEILYSDIILKILQKQCSKVQSNPLTDINSGSNIENSNIENYVLDKLCSITRLKVKFNKDSCWCELVKILEARLMFYYDTVSLPFNPYNPIIIGAESDTVIEIQKYLN